MRRLEKLERGLVWCMVWSGTWEHCGRECARVLSGPLGSSRVSRLEVEVEHLWDDAQRVACMRARRGRTVRLWRPVAAVGQGWGRGGRAVHGPRHLRVAEQLDEVGLLTAQEVKTPRSHTPDLVERRDAERLWGRAAWVRRGRVARFATAVAIRCPRDEEGNVEEGVVVEQADELEPDEVRA